MDDWTSSGIAGSVPGFGLCDTCVHQQLVRNTRGSSFSLCRRSRIEPDRFVRYPRIPVLTCSGYVRRGADAG